MNLRGIFTVFRKEFFENLRDRRTILTALFVACAVTVFLRFPLGEDDHAERLARLRTAAPPHHK